MQYLLTKTKSYTTKYKNVLSPLNYRVFKRDTIDFVKIGFANYLKLSFFLFFYFFIHSVFNSFFLILFIVNNNNKYILLRSCNTALAYWAPLNNTTTHYTTHFFK